MSRHKFNIDHEQLRLELAALNDAALQETLEHVHDALHLPKALLINEIDDEDQFEEFVDEQHAVLRIVTLILKERQGQDALRTVA